MNFYDNYAMQAKQYAVFPLDRSLEYAALGLAGEVGELMEAVYQHVFQVRLHLDRFETWDHRRSEEGDVWWYLAAVCDAADIPFSIVELATAPETSIENRATIDDMYMSLGRGLKHISGAVKKTIRDDGGYFSSKRKDAVIEGVMQIASSLKWLSADYKAIMIANLNKLEDRKRNGTIKGDGDNR